MAVTKKHFQPFAKRLLSTAIASASASALAIADTGLYPNQQWDCQPDSNGAWQCQRQAATPGAYPKPALLPVKSAPIKTVSKNTPQTTLAQSPWDWQPKQQLDDVSVCKVGCEGAYVAPAADWKNADLKPDDAPLLADANNTEMQNDTITLSGNVTLNKGYRQVKADSASLDRSNNELTINGNITVREPDLLIRADSAQLNTASNLGQFNNAQFLQYSSGTRSEAENMQRNSDVTLDLNQASLTQCPPDDEVWKVNASNIHLDTDEGWGSAKHARLNIQDVPVLYIPYMTFPIDDRRKTGFLFPTMSTGNNNGFELSTPYYLNLAPNYDATIAPRYIEKRGTMLELELRQLSQYGQWVLSGADLASDDLYTEEDTATVTGKKSDTPPQEHRWIGAINQQGNVLGVSTLIDYTKVSDEDFYRDFSTNSLELKRTDHLNQQLSFGYRVTNWQVGITAQDHQTIDPDLTKQYQLMPQLTIERNNSGESFETQWLLLAEYTDFQHDDSIDNGGTFVTGERAYAETGFSYPMHWAAGYIIPTAKVRHVSYQLSEYQLGSDETPSATAPLATLDMGLVFERNTSFGSSKYLQTLEPRIYYLYSEYTDQTGNPSFDAQQLNFSYSQLFRDTRFSGHDRLDDADQASIGITSRFIEDNEGREILTLSIGQIFYFDDRQVQNTGTTPETSSNSNIATEIQYQPSDNLWLNNSLLWDSRQDQMQEASFGAHYQSDHNSLYNLSYLYRREGSTNLGDGLRDLSQADLSMVLPVTDRWSLFTRYRYDMDGHSPLDQLAGVQYEDCCWMVRLLYQEGVKDEYRDSLTQQIIVEHDYAFILEFQLKGLGSLGSKAINLLEESILGYKNLD
ncbi:MAG: LPS-assembly protein LptD [Spongiibacteraceae bacterium]